MSKTRVSLDSNSNSLPHSAAGQRARDFSLLSAIWLCGRMTTQIPHFGQVTHEHTMRSAMRKLYGPPVVRRVPRRSSWWLRKVGNLGTAVLASSFFPQDRAREPGHAALECLSEVAR